MNDKKDVYMSPKQIRTMFGLSLPQIYNLLKDPNDPIPHYRIGKSYRIKKEELLDWLEKHHKK